MDEKGLDEQLEPIFNSLPIQDIAWRTSLERWTTETGDKRGPEKSVLAVRYEDDADISFLTQAEIYVYKNK